MDMQALRTDVESALRQLPPDIVQLLAGVAGKVMAEHRDKLEKTFPAIVEQLKPHAMAMMMEIGCGLIDRKELEDTLTAALFSVVKGTMGVNDGADSR